MDPRIHADRGDGLGGDRALLPRRAGSGRQLRDRGPRLDPHRFDPAGRRVLPELEPVLQLPRGRSPVRAGHGGMATTDRHRTDRGHRRCPRLHAVAGPGRRGRGRHAVALRVGAQLACRARGLVVAVGVGRCSGVPRPHGHRRPACPHLGRCDRHASEPPARRGRPRPSRRGDDLRGALLHRCAQRLAERRWSGRDPRPARARWRRRHDLRACLEGASDQRGSGARPCGLVRVRGRRAVREPLDLARARRATSGCCSGSSRQASPQRGRRSAGPVAT